MSYNPIVRTFNRLRAELVADLGVPRAAVRPAARLDDLVPRDRRRDFWARLRQAGLVRPEPRRDPSPRARVLLLLLGTLLVLACAVASPVTLLVFAALAALCWGLGRWHDAELSFAAEYGAETVGQLTLLLAPVRAESGYRWTHNDLSLKVRMMVANRLGVKLDAVRPETTFREMTGEW